MEVKREDAIRKGPWKAEEDEVLINHVNKYGPRDWSSIRSKGLLQRTGKSCRLRWVNKLRPNLKHGCKFSPEEERTVIELQAQFGNRWARIAKYLPGRTDNDVKNFWSSRQKRLARILQTKNATPKPQENKREVHSSHSVAALESLNISTFEEGESSSKYQSCTLPCMDDFEILNKNSVSNLVNQNPPSSDTNLVQVDYACDHNIISIVSESSNPFPQGQLPQCNLTLPSECQDLLARLDDPDLYDLFGPEVADLGNGVHFLDEPPFMEPYRGFPKDDKGNGPETPNTFFDDFPMDLFDHIEPPSSPSDW